jgi:uncharacterized protein YjbJ (UPF0337 family)
VAADCKKSRDDIRALHRVLTDGSFAPHAETHRGRGFERHASGAPHRHDDRRKQMDNSWQKKWEGRWDQFKGKVKQTWGQMTDDDCDVAEGKYDEMVGRIKTRTGEAEEAVRERLSAL